MEANQENQSTKQKVLCSTEPINMGSGQKPVKEVTLQSWKIFAIEAFLFCLTLGIGIVAAFRMAKIFEVQKITLPQISFWRFTPLEILFLTGFIIYFLLATLFIFFLIRFLKFKRGKGMIFKIIFVLAVSLGGLLFLETWLPEPIPLILISCLIFWWWKSPSVLNQDILMILGIAGIGSVLGLSFTPLIVVALLILFSIYDFVAVYKTKHMIKMAKEMLESRAILAFIIPPDLKNFQENLEKIQPGGKFLILGGGDVVFPLLFSVSLIPSGILNSIIIAIFSLIGLFLGFYIFTKQKIRQPIPALPPIALFSIIGYLVTLLIQI